MSWQELVSELIFGGYMTGFILLLIGALLTITWGIAHLFPTSSVVKGFGDISEDNKNIIRMEWINEGLALIFIGTIVLITAFIDDNSSLKTYINLAVVIMLISMAILSLFTGFKVNFLPFKLCPFIFAISALLILIGTFC